MSSPESHPLIRTYRAITESHFLSHKNRLGSGHVIQVKLIGVLSGILAGVSGGGLCLLQCEPVNCGLVSPFLGLEEGKAWGGSQGQGQRGDSASSHCHQTCSPEFHPQNLHGGRREATPASLPSSDLHICNSVHDVFIGFTYRRVGEELPTGMWVTPKQPYH